LTLQKVFDEKGPELLWSLILGKVVDKSGCDCGSMETLMLWLQLLGKWGLSFKTFNCTVVTVIIVFEYFSGFFFSFSLFWD